MRFIVYSKPECPYCFQVKKALELCGKDFVVYTLDEHFTKDEFYDEFGIGCTFPQVVVDDQHIGGCTDTIHYLRALSLI
jgi:glutaredoxin